MAHYQSGRHQARVNAVNEGAKLCVSCLQLDLLAKRRYGSKPAYLSSARMSPFAGCGHRLGAAE
jgi:hypothetical protein